MVLQLWQPASLHLNLTSDVTAADSDYDFTFEWDNATENYTMTTLYDRGYEGWIGETSAGDKEFRDSFQDHFPTPDYSAEDAGASTIGTGLLVCLFILVMLGLLGGAMVYIQGMEMGFKGCCSHYDCRNDWINWRFNVG